MIIPEKSFLGYKEEMFMIKQLGAIYIILGTCIAAGLLGLPIVTAHGSFSLTTMMLTSAWLVMSIGAWCIMKVNLWFPEGSNLITMSEQTLGHTVKWITWVVYLLLLYSLICAYLAASSDVLHALLASIHIALPRIVTTLIAAVIIGGVIYHGIRSVDLLNRFLMSAKLAIFILLVLVISPHAALSHLAQGDLHWRSSVWLVMITAFGYAIILPSIRVYLRSDKKALMRVVLIGSLVPLLVYLLWIALIQSVLPRVGAHGLISMIGAENTNSVLMKQLADLTQYGALKSVSIVFISISSITGLLTVSLSLADFLTDGLKRVHFLQNKVLIVTLAMVPSTLIILINPAIFTSALAYAGIFCLYILAGLPIAMYIAGRIKGMVTGIL